MLPFWATMSKQRSLCRKDEISKQTSFDIVAFFGNKVKRCFDIVAKNEATFDIVAFDNVASTMLLVWTGLKRRTWLVYLRLGWSEGVRKRGGGKWSIMIWTNFGAWRFVICVWPFGCCHYTLVIVVIRSVLLYLYKANELQNFHQPPMTSVNW